MPVGDSQVEEQKEPHFLTGKSRASALDYAGAIESFEKALEVNPHSASAHFELAWIYEKPDNSLCDNAAAIYHYQRFLRYSPTSSKADLAKAHINACKLELAKTVSSLGPLPAAAQRDLEKVLLENRDLKARIVQWEAYYAATRAQTPTNVPVLTPVTNAPASNPPPAAREATLVESPRASSSSSRPSTTTAANRTPTRTTMRTHTVKAGESPASIARRYSLPVSVLLAANPQARPNHLQVGQTLNIPAP
ncbi:MAG: LysM peptidoglycan-binding protein [Pedosphaera sp.]|nr:LysM peptidoglycan-binding protein [Pedosphaera sp.]